ncbi:MAG: TonB family protein [Gammaproteobacteria bacterium]
MDSLIRIGVSLCVAVVLVGGFAMFGVNTYYKQPPLNQVAAFRVETATQAELDMVARAREPKTAEPEPPPPARAIEERDGFVQLEFVVTPKGRASDVRVVGAMPSGYFEEQAIKRIERLRFLPEKVDGVAVESTRTQIVEFKYAPAVTRAVEP